MKLYLVLNARMPNKKAYGIHIAKMCEAFIERGIDLTLVIPSTHASRVHPSLQSFYGLRVEVPVKRVGGLDWYGTGRIGFFLGSMVFIVCALLYLWGERIRGNYGVVYTVDMDTFSFAPLLFGGFPVYMELHDWRGESFLTSWFFKRAQGVITTNSETAERLAERLGRRSGVCIEPNGVEGSWFSRTLDKVAARTELGLPPDAKIALYVGRIYKWKGLDILVDAAAQAPDITWYLVGDTKEVFMRETGKTVIPPNLHIQGECPFDVVPVWLSAADVLLVLGTETNEQSSKHTAPMKVYEYLALERPLIAAKTRALVSILPENVVRWYTPDSSESLTHTVREHIMAPADSAMIERGVALAAEHTWEKRAERIHKFMEADTRYA